MTTLFKDLPLNKPFRNCDHVYRKIDDTTGKYIGRFDEDDYLVIKLLNDLSVKFDPNAIVEDNVPGLDGLFSADTARYQQVGSD